LQVHHHCAAGKDGKAGLTWRIFAPKALGKYLKLLYHGSALSIFNTDKSHNYAKNK